jgi:hypothetical protein
LALLGAQVGLVADDCEGDGIGALRGEIVSIVRTGNMLSAGALYARPRKL